MSATNVNIQILIYKNDIAFLILAKEPTGNGTAENLNVTSDTGTCSEVLSFFKKAPSASVSSVAKSSLASANSYKELVAPAHDKNVQSKVGAGKILKFELLVLH